MIAMSRANLLLQEWIPNRIMMLLSLKKGNKYYYGYKGHIGIDHESGIIRRKQYTTASVHDSQMRENLMSGDERSQYGDKGYVSDDLKHDLRKKDIY